MSPKKWKDIYAKEFDSAAFGCIIELTETHEFIGYALLHIREPKNRDGDFGFGLLPQFWGKGYGTEALEFIIEHAFRWFGLHRFSLGTFSPNERALKMYLKVGFTIEGRKRECLWYDNKFVDIIDLGILRREWAAKRWNAEEQKNVDEV
ncbi:acyl-CoA N-acyltransferase [Coniophora puteana RWD-64-598 SS2]|uniref:Acyl-CoA N-acyltransferase n=1 Tax=Coniophora puteana (strain RWD-64-598) TaxID=741705 RepID=A0A5M3MJ59_CONPW|nr:acyl-CoA N-acyltransferase [Coniophora puteana RWD-64-598 SS2]EIW79076.1 acyl-CoA N-acyltransferase [Coniophora puteana RWD-64-598 SS2]